MTINNPFRYFKISSFIPSSFIFFRKVLKFGCSYVIQFRRMQAEPDVTAFQRKS